MKIITLSLFFLNLNLVLINADEHDHKVSKVTFLSDSGF